MSIAEATSQLGESWTRVKDLMRECLVSNVQLLNTTNEGIIAHSGKLLRPLVSLLTAKSIGEITEDSIRFAAATEILHNATLIHDDVTDESKERRGVPTLMSTLGPSSAVLVGDFWLAKAVSLVYGTQSRYEVGNYYAGTLSDLAEGEMLQLEKSIKADTTEEDYFRIIFCKTASLFRAACISAAISVNAPKELVDAADKYGTALGIAFQIKDDILDYAGTEELGKPTGVDIKEGKITLPLLGAMKNSPEEAKIRDLVRNIAGKDEDCAEVRDFVLKNGGIEYASGVLDQYIRKAVSAVDAYSASPSREALKEIARFNAYRQV